MTIDLFKGRFYLLSNFYPCPVIYEDIEFRSTEGAYQAAKSLDPEIRKRFADLKGGEAKALGGKIELREDWDKVKYEIMYELNCQKYSYPEMRGFLLGTGDSILIEGCEWHDNFWGDCYCQRCTDIPGLNNLGKILMSIRETLRK